MQARHSCTKYSSCGEVRRCGRPRRTFTLSTAFINQLARHFPVGTAEPYKTIQQAVDAAAKDDEIDVDPGVYGENS